MNLEHSREQSPITVMYRALQAFRPNWHVEIGKPSGRGWISGTDLRTAREGPFNALLLRIGERLHTSDRRTIAASFALRYGWSSGIAIAPYILHECVPKITLDNVSFKFHENTSFERAAVHQPEGVILEQEGLTQYPGMEVLPDRKALLDWLRNRLILQAQPIVKALYYYSCN